MGSPDGIEIDVFHRNDVIPSRVNVAFCQCLVHHQDPFTCSERIFKLMAQLGASDSYNDFIHFLKNLVDYLDMSVMDRLHSANENSTLVIHDISCYGVSSSKLFIRLFAVCCFWLCESVIDVSISSVFMPFLAIGSVTFSGLVPSSKL